MGAQPNIIDELEESISRGSSDRRVETLRKVTDLFINDAPAFSEAQVGLFDDVIGRLAEAIETQARAELAERLAPVGNAPLGVVGALARDDSIAVAGPILSGSARLDTTTLVEIAATKGQAHLLAISGRDVIAPAVTDVLVARGDQQVVRKVAANDGASFSERGFNALVARAKTDDLLAETVGTRKDIPPQQFRAILASAKDKVQKKLLAAAAASDHARIQSVVGQTAERLAPELNEPKRDYSAAQRIVLALHRSSQLSERELVAFAKAGKFEETVCSLSALCGVPIDVVDRLMSGERPDPILILARSINLSWSTVKAIILLRGGQGGSSTAGLEEAFENYEKLTAGTAQRVIRFWQVRQTAGRAG